MVADVETRRYSPYLSSGDFFGKSYEENQVTEKSHTICNTIYLRSAICDLRFSTRNCDFAQGNSKFRELPIRVVSQLKDAQIR
jgi:hypothetical protein